jgi:SAM-dependent methyltransferase
MNEGWEGWDEYAPFYDWENARTVGRRDVAFWRRLAAERSGPILELGCGTGRIAVPILKAGASLVGIDRSHAMLARARQRAKRAAIGPRAMFVRGDIRALPFRSADPIAPSRAADSRKASRSAAGFDLVLAPYGILQSLTRERDLHATLSSVARVLRPGGMFGIDLVPDLPRWTEYKRKVSMRGRRSSSTTLTLIESVRQDRRRRLTIFDQEYVERRGRTRRVHSFALTFRTLSVPEIVRRLEAAGFSIRAILGDYQGRPWDERADVWVILAVKG